MRKLYRSRESSVVAGICGGLGEYFNIDPVIIRIIFLVSAIWGAGILLYIIAWVIVPLRPTEESQEIVEGLDVNKNMKYLPGLLLILVGTSFILGKVWHWISFYYFFSFLIIAIGAILIYRAIAPKKEHRDEG